MLTRCCNVYIDELARRSFQTEMNVANREAAAEDERDHYTRREWRRPASHSLSSSKDLVPSHVMLKEKGVV